jgi:hypothetical protein
MINVRAARDLLNLDGADGMPQNMAHVSGVPVEAFERVGHNCSIYNQCIYLNVIAACILELDFVDRIFKPDCVLICPTESPKWRNGATRDWWLLAARQR